MLRIDVAKGIKSVKGNTSLKIDVSIKTDQITAVFGNSGEGKTTLFNMIAGFVRPDRGLISFNDEVWYSDSDKVFTKTQKRNIAYIFQENNLFPHFTVRQNIEYAIPKTKLIDSNIGGLLEDLGIAKLADSYPHQLSGGQSQRVAIARALAQGARIILMDEPFSALDLEIKLKLYRLIEDFHEKYQLSLLLITHDLQDIDRLCTDVIRIEDHSVTEIISKEQFNINITKRMASL